MLEGLKQPLQPGETFPLTLTFANAGTVAATATVQKGAGMAMDQGSMGGMPMQTDLRRPRRPDLRQPRCRA